MNIYEFHSNPEILNGYKDRVFLVPGLAYDYAVNKGERVPEAEPAIMKHPKLAYQYAAGIMKKPWPDTKLGKKAEAAIARDAHWAYQYAKDILEDRFPAGEDTIASDADYFYLYARSYSEAFNLKLLDGKFIPK